MRRPSARRALALSAVALLGVGTLAACGDDDDSSSTNTEATTPEDVKAPMADVLAKLPTMVEYGNEAAQAAAAGDFDKASESFTELHDEVWETIEGTIKDTDADTYERIETAQGLIKDGAESKNAERVQQGADDQSAAADDFIAANSGASATTSTTAAHSMSDATLPGD